jgi:tetraacyldisaccharide-1-P 4'-kinase
MTEKDAVKLDRKLPDKFWLIPVDLTMNDEQAAALLEMIDSRLQVCGDKS